MPACPHAPPPGKGGSPGDGPVMVPLAVAVVVVIAVVTALVLLMPAEGTRRLPTVPPSVQIRIAALLFAQVKRHAAATLH